MARRRTEDLGERRTAGLTVQFTPTERKELREAATTCGVPIGAYVRQLCLRRGGRSAVVAGSRRNPDAKALADQLCRIGNLLNQLTRIANTTGELRRPAELSMVLDMVKQALARAIAL